MLLPTTIHQQICATPSRKKHLKRRFEKGYEAELWKNIGNKLSYEL
jgi:hypothetical protein